MSKQKQNIIIIFILLLGTITSLFIAPENWLKISLFLVFTGGIFGYFGKVFKK